MDGSKNKAQTSITIDVEVLKNARVYATQAGYRSLSALVEDLLYERLEHPIIFNVPGVDKIEEVGVD